jgi:membrane protein
MSHTETPVDLPRRAWWGALRRTFREFMDDKLLDWAAALTYYSILSLFPALVVLMSVVGLIGETVTRPLIENLQQLAPGQAREVLVNVVRELEGSAGVAGPVALLGLLSAVWASSGYIGGFIRASNAIYEVDEGRPIWKTIPLRIALTLTMVILLAITVLGVVLTGGVAEWLGDTVGLGSTFVTVWDIAKWPVLAALMSLAIALLFWASPNVRHPGFRWLTPGSVLAVLVWVAASAGFALYVTNFASYNKVYGSLAGVVVFLIWLWLSNLAVLFGAEFDAELAREREISEGLPDDEEPFLEPRDTRAMD